MALGPAEACPGSPTEHYSMIPSDLCPTEEYGAASETDASASDVGQAEDADYYDRGEVAASVEDGSQDDSLEAKSNYRYEYPEESYARYGEAGSKADYAEHYYSKYGYEYANPEEKYGYAGPHAESNAEDANSASNEPMSQESADAEAGESSRNADSPEKDPSSATNAAANDATEESADEMPSEGSDSAWKAQRDVEQEAAPTNTSPEAAYHEHGMENLTTGEESETAESYSPTEEEMLARTELPDVDAITTEQNDEIGPYQMEEYHPRYGYRFGYRRSYYATTMTEEANTSSPSPTTAAAPTAAAETESAQSQPQPGSVAERYGYAEYMGEDYLSEIEDSSRAAVDPEQQRQFDPENSEPMDPEGGSPVTPEKNASIDSESQEMASAESNGAMASEVRQSVSPESGDTAAPEYARSVDSESREMAASEGSESATPEGTQPMDAEGSKTTTPDYGQSMHREYDESTTPDNQESMDAEHGEAKTPENSESSAPAEAPAAKSDESMSSNYDYAEPYRYYGHDYGRETAERHENGSDSDQSLRIEESSSMQEPQAKDETESGIELFAYRPTELLTSSDQDVLRTLARLFEEPSGVRRAALNDYLETQGTNALDFATRFEDLTGIEFLGLADDLPGVAAFLASYRLLEQSELGMDEASDLLRRSLQRFAPDWINGVNEITANAQESTSEPVNMDGAQSDSSMGSANNQVIKALGTLASQSLREIGDLANGIPSRFSQVAWTVLLPQFGQDWSVGNLSRVFGDLQR